MTRYVAPLPQGAAEPLALMHGACFPDDPWDAATFERILALYGVFGYLAWMGDAPAGFILARDLGEEAEILTFGVLPGMRRLNIGRSLLDEVVAQTGRRCIGTVVLEVAAENDAARRLYDSTGFVQVGRRPRYYDREQCSVDAVILRLGIPRLAASDDAAR